MARGISARADILPVTLDGIPLATMWAELQRVNATWNKGAEDIATLFVTKTTDSSALVPLSNDGADFERQSEFGSPQGLRATPQFSRVGFPLEWFDLGLRYTRAFLRNATADQIRAQYDTALHADARNVFQAVLRSVFTQVAPASRRLNDIGVPIFSLFDGGADSKPADYAGRTFAANHTHYSTTGSALPDGLDLNFLIKNVTEHGFGSNPGERIVVLVNPVEGETIRGFKVGSTSPYDFIPAAGAPAYLSADTIIGDVAPGTFNNLPVSGSYGRALIIELDYVPAGYMVAVAVTADASRTVLGFREHPNAQNRGLQLLEGSVPNSPIQDSTLEHGFGVGVRQRGAAACMQVTTSSTYTSPQIG